MRFLNFAFLALSGLGWAAPTNPASPVVARDADVNTNAARLLGRVVERRDTGGEAQDDFVVYPDYRRKMDRRAADNDQPEDLVVYPDYRREVDGR
ncbi:MAG: hypothetical protein M1837_002289 [Sclerophora amabilis]|nr:MAG: hypothetical protein M1837_002289 [Sclerophora amabilis]